MYLSYIFICTHLVLAPAQIWFLNLPKEVKVSVNVVKSSVNSPVMVT